MNITCRDRFFTTKLFILPSYQLQMGNTYIGMIYRTRFLDALIKRNSSKGGKMYDEKKFWKSDYWTKANMHLLVGDVKQAVTILFENDDVDAAIEL